MNIIAIAAVDENWGLGYKSELLERIPEDMKRFKEITENGIVVMGRKTQESLPHKKLSNRMNIVLTGQDLPDEDDIQYINRAGIDYIFTLFRIYECGYDRYQSFTDKELPRLKNIYVIGGGSIYEQLLPDCDKLYLTKIYKSHENVDVYFPEVKDDEWEIEWESEMKEYDGIKYQFINYKRVNT